MYKQPKLTSRWLSGFIQHKGLVGDDGPGDPEKMDESLEEFDEILKKEFKNLPKLKCSPGVRDEILRLTVQQEKTKWRLPTYEWKSHWKLELAVAGVAMAFVMLFVFKPEVSTQPDLPVQAEMSIEEQKAAQEKLKWTLAYTSQLLNKSEKKAIGEAVVNELPKTLRNTLKKTVPLFKGGES